MKNFKDIPFGLASAEDESARSPNLLIEGYWDTGNIVKDAKSGHKFLFLGYKGSGKSSLAEHLKLQKGPLFFPTVMNLVDFPYSSFKKIVSGESDPEGKFPTAWSWLLLLKIIRSLRDDNGSPSISERRFTQLIEKLTSMGLLDSDNLNKIVTQSTKNSFRAQIPSLLEFGAEENYSSAELVLQVVIDLLKDVVNNFKTESHHLLIIDGLDDILSTKEVQYQSLAALVFQVNRLNQEFIANDAPIKILLLCRTELFERLPNANKNKIRQNSAEYLEWYNPSRGEKISNLWRLIDLRSKLFDPEIGSAVKEYFPISIDGAKAEDFLLNLTRHTPRDLIQLLTNIQRHTVGPKPTRDNIIDGAKDYSYNYFAPEIKDELSGYFSPEDIELTFQVLGGIRKRDFGISEAQALLEQRQQKLHTNLESILGALFECSAIGNVQHRNTGTTFYTFKYRNRHSSFNTTERIILHKGLWKAMNLI